MNANPLQARLVFFSRFNTTHRIPLSQRAAHHLTCENRDEMERNIVVNNGVTFERKKPDPTADGRPDAVSSKQ